MHWLRAGIWQELTKRETVKKMLVFGVFIGLPFGWVGGLLFGWVDGLTIGLTLGLTLGLFSGLIFSLVNGFFAGVSGDLLEKRLLTKPNQGIQYSARNSVRVGLLGGLVSGLIFGPLIFGLFIGLDYRWALGLGLSGGLTFGLFIGLSLGLSNGGVACIQHAVLRIFLWRTGYTPWGFGYFLDYAAERILLRKVGGGYIFIHQMFMEYFATLYTAPLVSQAIRLKQRTRQMTNPPKNPARVVWVYGILSGICLGSILVPLDLVLDATILAIILAIVVFLLVGMLAAKQTGRVATGTLAGLVTGLTSGIIYGIFSLVFLLTVNREEITAQMMSLNNNLGLSNNLSPDQVTGLLVFFGTLSAVIPGLVLLGFGAGIGLLGGLIGKRNARVPPIR